MHSFVLHFSSAHPYIIGKRILKMMISCVCICRDIISEIFEGDPTVVLLNKKRQAIETKIEKKKRKGENTEVDELELAYQDIYEEVMVALRDGIKPLGADR